MRGAAPYAGALQRWPARRWTTLNSNLGRPHLPQTPPSFAAQTVCLTGFHAALACVGRLFFFFLRRRPLCAANPCAAPLRVGRGSAKGQSRRPHHHTDGCFKHASPATGKSIRARTVTRRRMQARCKTWRAKTREYEYTHKTLNVNSKRLRKQRVKHSHATCDSRSGTV